MQYFPRQLFYKIEKHLSFKEFIIIAGARQTGKTTLLRQIFDYLIKINKVVYSFTLEDRTILDELNSNPENIFKFIELPKNKKTYILIDEVQYLKDPSNFLKLLYDKYAERIKIVATGSSAFYIDSKFKDSLAGRKILFDLYTLNFEEFLVFKNKKNELFQELIKIRKSKSYISLFKQEIVSNFNEYITYGGYPSVVLAKTTERKISILKELVNSYIKRDILEAEISHQESFYKLLRILASQTGSLVNTNELSKTIGLSNTAINNYIYILRKCFHIHLLKPFSNNKRKELLKMPKVYFHDCGLRNILINQFHELNERLDKGALIENYVFTRLRDVYDLDIINYWRTADGNEVDFIISTSLNKGFAYEVKYNEKAFQNNKYKKFMEIYPDYPLQCLAYEANGNKNFIISL